MLGHATEGIRRTLRIPKALKIVAGFSFLCGVASFCARFVLTRRARPDAKVVNQAGHLRHLIAQYQVQFIMKAVPKACLNAKGGACNFNYVPVHDAEHYLSWMLHVLSGLSGAKDLSEEGVPVASEEIQPQLQLILRNITAFNRTWFGQEMSSSMLGQRVVELTRLLDYTDGQVNSVLEKIASSNTSAIFSFFLASGFVGITNAILLLVLSLREHLGITTKQRAEITSQKVEINTQQEELEAAAEGAIRILNHFCDCLVQIGDELQITRPTQRFAALLLTDAARLEGRALSDFMVMEQDRSRVLQSMQRCKCEREFLEMLPIKLRDTIGRIFTVNAYLTSCPDNRGKTRFLLGLVEDQERLTNDDVLPAIGSKNGDMLSNYVPSATSTRSTESWSFCDDIESCREGAPSVWMDLGSEGLPIIECSDSFISLHGPIAQGLHFQSLMMEREFRSFFRFLMAEMRPIIDAQMGLQSARTTNGRVLKTKMVFGAEYTRVMCSVDLERSNEAVEDSDEDCIPVRVEIRMIRGETQKQQHHDRL